MYGGTGVASPVGTQGEPVASRFTGQQVLRDLTYAPLELQTHPIDLAYGSQGWGPMDGPYTPFNFPSPVTALFGDGINITWMTGDNAAQQYQPPPWATFTVFPDPSMSLVNNSHYATSIFRPVPSSATIQQGPPPVIAQPQGKAALLRSALRTALGMS